MKAALEDLAQIIANFLLENGGMHNGHLTYVRGDVEVHTSRCLEWSTPAVDDLTGRERKRLGGILNDRLVSAMKTHKMQSCEIAAEPGEWGVYKTLVRIHPTVEVKLWT